MKKNSIILMLIFTIILSLNISAFADSSNEIRMGTLDSDSQYPFFDETDSISEETKNVILNINKNCEDTGAQVGVILLNSLNGNTIEDKTTELFNAWGLGDKDKNNGVLMLISKEDRLFRIEVGEGLRNTVLSDRDAADILDKMKPYCKDEAYNLAVQVGLFEIDKKFNEYRTLLSIEKEEEKPVEETVPEKETSSQTAGVISENDYIKPDYEEDNSFPFTHMATTVIPITFGLGLVLFFVISMISTDREAKREEEKRQEEIRARGKAVDVKIQISNQYDMKEDITINGYENYELDKNDIENKVKNLLKSDKLFTSMYYEYNKITGFKILEITGLTDGATFKEMQDKTIKVKLELEREEDVFMQNPRRVQATKDFYNTLSPEEKAFYTSRSNNSQKSFYSTNFWFYMYLYMLIKSDRSNDFRGYMDSRNVSSDRFYTSKKDIEAREAARIAEEKRRSARASNNDDSSFSSGSSFYNSGSSFGGFGGGSSSGGGASGGF